MLTPLAFLQTGAGRYAWAEGAMELISYPRAGGPAFLAPDFSLATDRPWWLDAGTARLRELTADEWRARFAVPDAQPIRVRWEQPDEARFRAGFARLQPLFERGLLRKGVPATSMRAALTPEAAAALFRQLLARVPDLPARLVPYGLFLPVGRGGEPEFILGATPELLFELHDCQSLSTMAVAGTRQTQATGTTALAESPKDRDEHQSVVEDLLAQLSEWGQPRATATEVRTFGQLVHLVAEIRLDARVPLDFEAVVRRLHPTPALGVYPRGAAGSEWLAALDPARERNRFGAPFGLRWPSGSGRCVVAIRCLQYAAGRLEIWAGCGVVPMSRYDDEWQEVLHKMQAVRSLWAI